jgi:16S rRNA (guanine966-N2)-methyltransferase
LTIVNIRCDSGIIIHSIEFVVLNRQSSIVNHMRVISGIYKGRRLRGPRGTELRPTGDRLKEALFNILGPGIAGAKMLDVFAGAGAIGIEALSRGASEVVFIESGAEGRRLIRQNLELCGVGSKFRIIEQDVFTAMRALARQGFRADIAFFDPPYIWQPYVDLLDIAFNRDLVSQLSRVVIEHHRKAVLPDSGDRYLRSRMVRQGDHCLSFYEFKGAGIREPEEGS